MTAVCAIDPGPEESGWIVLDDRARWPMAKGIDKNEELLDKFSGGHFPKHFAIEWIASYGMAVGAEVFDTCRWVGRFEQSLSDHFHEVELIFRKEVKLHICNNGNAKDANIRQALIDMYGPGKEKAIGLKKTPGPLYGIKSHVWAALALAVTYQDRVEGRK